MDKDSINNGKLNEKEKTDVLLALEIMDKVSKSELEFAGNVLREMRIKTTFANFDPPMKYVMQYPTLEKIKYFNELKEMKND